MLHFFDDTQKEKIVSEIAKELGLSPNEVRQDKKLIDDFIEEKCKREDTEKEEIIKL